MEIKITEEMLRRWEKEDEGIEDPSPYITPRDVAELARRRRQREGREKATVSQTAPEQKATAPK